MARLRTVEAPARSDVYFGMVVCSFVAMLVAIGFLVAEMTFTYDWQSTPPAVAAPALPAKPTRTVATPGGGTTLAPAEAPKPAVALKPEETPPPPTAVVPIAPAPIPSTLTAKPSPAPTAPAVPAPESPKPVTTSSGPTPGFQFPKR
jgi:hypothetical protein